MAPVVSMAVRVTAALAAAASPALAQLSLYAQPQAPAGPSFISRTGPGGLSFTNRRVADNFSLPFDAEVRSVRFWGGDESNAPATPLSNVARFNIQVFLQDDTTGGPGALRYAIDVPIAMANPVAVPGQTVGILGAPMFQFEISTVTMLGTGFQLEADAAYWISVAAQQVNPPSFTEEAWQWSRSTTGDTLIAQDRFDGNGFQLRTLASRNAAFELIGIPTPGAAATLALAGLLAARRRR